MAIREHRAKPRGRATPFDVSSIGAPALPSNFEAFDGYVWEALRFAPIAPYVFRLSNRDYTIAPGTDRETTIPAGTTVLALTQSAMFDDFALTLPGSGSVNLLAAVPEPATGLLAVIGLFALGIGRRRSSTR